MGREPARKRRCKARSSQTGKPCKRWAMNGSLVCASHGGKAPQVRDKARERQALEEAQRMVALAGVELRPMEHLLDCLYRAAQLAAVWGLMVSALDELADQETAARGEVRGELGYFEAGEDSRDELRVYSHDRLLALNTRGEAQLHPYVIEYDRALDRHAKIAKLCIDARVDERVIELAEEQVQIVTGAFEAMLTKLGLDAEQRQEARRAYAGELRLVS